MTRDRGGAIAYVCLAVMTAVLAAGCGSSRSESARPSSASPSSASQSPGAYPSSIVVLGHSGATGLHSDPTSRPTDARQNSWATGDNPEVDSIYTRLLALNPAVRGHNANVAVDGTGVKDLAGQADKALAVEPRPDLFLIETVDNDMRCDGTDAANLGPFGAALEDVIRKISLGAPDAHIFIVSSPWSTSENYFSVAQQHSGARASNTGPGLCDLFSPSGEPLPSHQAELEHIAQQYLATVESVCAKFPTCRYDKGALHNLMITADDLTPEGFHLTISGQQKVAAIEWAALAL